MANRLRTHVAWVLGTLGTLLLITVSTVSAAQQQSGSTSADGNTRGDACGLAQARARTEAAQTCAAQYNVGSCSCRQSGEEWTCTVRWTCSDNSANGSERYRSGNQDAACRGATFRAGFVRNGNVTTVRRANSLMMLSRIEPAKRYGPLAALLGMPLLSLESPIVDARDAAASAGGSQAIAALISTVIDTDLSTWPTRSLSFDALARLGQDNVVPVSILTLDTEAVATRMQQPPLLPRKTQLPQRLPLMTPMPSQTLHSAMPSFRLSPGSAMSSLPLSLPSGMLLRPAIANI